MVTSISVKSTCVVCERVNVECVKINTDAGVKGVCFTCGYDFMQVIMSMTGCPQPKIHDMELCK